ncbi:MAG: GNAT family N-acetyltransferase, partial [Rhodobacterales bacterium]
MQQDMTIRDLKGRELKGGEDAALWALLEPVFRAGDTYAIDPDISREAALADGCGPGRKVSMVEIDGAVVGSASLGRNQGGGGAPVCN